MGITPATFSRATIRCDLLYPVLVCLVIRLVYAIFGDFAEYVCPPRTSRYRPGCTSFAVRSFAVEDAY
jgi:hypothetical protein